MSFRNSEGASHDSLGGFSGISKMGNHARISKSVGILEVLGDFDDTRWLWWGCDEVSVAVAA